MATSVPVTSGVITSGARYFLVTATDTDGYAIGGDGTAPTAGSQTGKCALIVPGIVSAPFNIPDVERETVVGGDSAMTQFIYSSTELPGGTLNIAVQQSQFDNLVQGTLTETYGTGVKVTPYGLSTTSLQNVSFMVTRQMKKWNPANQGVGGWETYIIPQANVVPQLSAFTQRTHEDAAYGVTMSIASRLPWGETVTTGNYGTAGAAIFRMESTYPFMLESFTGDGTETEFTLSYAPLSGGELFINVEGTLQTVTTHYSVSGSTVTFVSAPTSAQRIVVWYEIAANNLVPQAS